MRRTVTTNKYQLILLRGVQSRSENIRNRKQRRNVANCRPVRAACMMSAMVAVWRSDGILL